MSEIFIVCTHICVKTKNEQIEMFDMFDKLLVLMCNRIETAILNEWFSVLFYCIEVCQGQRPPEPRLRS